MDHGASRRPDGRATGWAARAGLAAGLAGWLGGCAPPPDQPQTHVGTCSHFQNGERRLEDVPDCLLRSRHTLINGLGPADTQDRS